MVNWRFNHERQMPPFSFVLAIIATICIPRAFGVHPVSLECKLPPQLLIITPHGGVNILDAEISITYQPDQVVLFLKPHTHAADIFIGNSTVNFKGQAYRKNSYWSSIGNVSTAGVYNKGVNNAYEVSECRLHLSATSNRENIVDAVENAIRDIASSCLAREICKNVPQNKDTVIVEYESSDETLSAASSQPQIHTLGSDRLNLNKVVDYALERIKKMLIGTKKNTVIIPEIHQTFETGAGIFKLTGQFDTGKGQFQNLATLHRTSDAEVVQEKKKYFIAAGFGLGYSNVNFEHFKLKFGPAAVSGRLATSIDGVSIAARVSVDYGPKQCVKSLDYVKVTDMGQVRIYLSGMGNLGIVMSSFATWMTANWKDTIISNIEKNLQSIAQNQMAKFDCEKYRMFA